MGCHIGHSFSGELTYADDLTLLSPKHYGCFVLISECEMYGTEYNILFNGCYHIICERILVIYHS